jgi:hypothetical protein
MVYIDLTGVTGQSLGETVDSFTASSEELRPEEEIGR